MKIRPKLRDTLLTIETPYGSQGKTRSILCIQGWTRKLKIDDLLHALCGVPDDGWYPYNEIDETWLCQCLRIAAECDDTTIGGMAISDPVNLRQTPESLAIDKFGDVEPSPSQIAAAGLAVVLISRAFEASRDEAIEVIRMNLFGECVPVEG